MDKQQILPFYIIGIAVRTTNENGQAGKDIPALWERFISEHTEALIPNKVGTEIYCVYTDYEKDHTRPYTTILGCKVEHLDIIPEGMIAKTISGGNYARYVAKGNLSAGAVYNEWVKIWNSDIDRAFTADFEVYGSKAANSSEAEVDVYIAL